MIHNGPLAMASPPRRAPDVAFTPNLIGIRTTARVALNCTRSHPGGLPTIAFTLNLIRIREYHATRLRVQN